MKLTHGIQVLNDYEGTKRKMSLQRYEENGEGRFLILIETTYPDQLPAKTELSLSEYGYSMFCEFMGVAPFQLENYKIEAEK